MKALNESLNESLLTEALINPSAVKPEAIAGRAYTGAIGFIEGKGTCAGVIIGQPFAIDDTAGEKAAASLASKDFKMKTDLDALLKAIEKNKKGAYDEVLKKDKYKSMMYVYFVSNKTDEIHCCLYSPMNVYLKGNYAYALKV
jgi:hypothetical protein